MGISEILMIIYLTLGLGCCLAKHGEPHTGYYNFWTELISMTIQIILLCCGGFFK